MPQLGPHIYPDTKEGKEAYRAMKARMEGEVAKTTNTPSTTSLEPVEGDTVGVEPSKKKRKPKE